MMQLCSDGSSWILLAFSRFWVRYVAHAILLLKYSSGLAVSLACCLYDFTLRLVRSQIYMGV
jgi:hypothetical protein